MSAIKLLLADDNRLLREGVRRILCSERFDVASEVSSFAEALEVLRGGKTDIHLVVGDPGGDVLQGLEAVKEITASFPDVKVVLLTDGIAPRWSDAALSSGAVGFLSKNISAEALRHSLDLVMLGEHIVPTVLPRSWAQAAVPRVAETTTEPTVPLSGRENQILRCLVNGLPNKLIARELDMAEATVKVHLKALLRKLKAQNRTQAAIWALHNAPALAAGGQQRSHKVETAATAPRYEGNDRRRNRPDRRTNNPVTLPQAAALPPGSFKLHTIGYANGQDDTNVKEVVKM